MEVIQNDKKAFEECFQNTLNKLKLISLNEKIIDVSLNNQADVINFISNLYRQFHYEVCILKDKLKER